MLALQGIAVSRANTPTVLNYPPVKAGNFGHARGQPDYKAPTGPKFG